MCRVVNEIENRGTVRGEENYKRKLQILRDRMAETDRQLDFVDAIGNDKKLEELFREFNVN